MTYDWPREIDWQRGWMTGNRNPIKLEWDFIHTIEDCRWADCEFHPDEDW